ncbi:MAG: alpha-amylase [Desulfuromonadales bacterium]|nr:alpha-amylase [Desulfuromonadales bacterium]
MKEQRIAARYFPHAIQISAQSWRSHNLGALSEQISTRGIPGIIFFRQLALRLNRQLPQGATPVHAGQINLFASLQAVFRYLIDVVAEQQVQGLLEDALRRSGIKPADETVRLVASSFVEQFPPAPVLEGAVSSGAWLDVSGSRAEHTRTVLRELLLLKLASENPAVDSFRQILDDGDLIAACEGYPRLVTAMTAALASGPTLPGFDMTLPEVLWAPIKASPGSLAGQVAFIREQWGALLPPDLWEELTGAFDILLEEERERGWGGGESGPTQVMEFGHPAQPDALFSPVSAGGGSVLAGYDYPEYEQFSSDADWMSNVVMMAKMVYIWLDQLSSQYGRPITCLDQVPDEELDRLAGAGFSALWLIGVWERSPASRRIKQLCGNSDAIASAYSLYDYEIAADLGGWDALANLRERSRKRGIRLASDMVPNHTGIYSRWVVEHPDWFIQTDYPPFPSYQFNGEDLSCSENVALQIEDGYWTKRDAAVVFRLVDRTTGRTRYIYHGNDGTSFPWNDTAQLNYLMPEVREAVIQTILHVARNFPIIRFDAAMTLAKKHFQRLWFPIRGLGGGVPSRAEHGMTREEFDALFPVEFWRQVVDRVAVEAPGTLLLAEAFWMMEGYFVRTLGMHRVYNSAFMNMLKREENAKYRKTIKNVLEFNPEILKRFVNFMNNPDEKTAVEQFGTEGKYFGACVLMVTMPGLPMFGHGQLEGLREKYGMEYRRAYWDESVDQGLLQGHRMWIFPLLHRRGLFSGSENFVLYDFETGSGVDENVFAYSNRAGEQRALVLYHNHYAVTAGLIRESSPIAVTGGGESPELYRTTIAESLGFVSDLGVYYAFRDVSSGLEFLRSGQELTEKGLYAELGEYEFHVFLDFRMIRDDSDGSWKGLCAALNGLGVENLEDERRQVRFAEQNSAFRTVLELAQSVSGSVLADLVTSGVLLNDSRDRFQATLRGQPADAGVRSSEIVPDMLQAISLMEGLSALRTSSLHAKEFISTVVHATNSVAGARVLLAWMLLRDSEPDALDRFGFEFCLRRMHSIESGQDAPGTGDPVQLLRALLACAHGGLMKSSTPFNEIFSIPSCCSYMLIHESGGTTWFNKERFEELATWILVIKLCDRAAAAWQPAGRTLAAWCAASGRELQRLTELATHAGYRLTLFRNLIAPVPKRVTGKRADKDVPLQTAQRSTKKRR